MDFPIPMLLCLVRTTICGGGGAFFWIFALLILAGGGFGFGGNRGNYVTEADLSAGLNNQQTQAQLQQIALSSANNNYETAQLIARQTDELMQQNNTNTINVIQGFNALSQQIQGLSSQMNECCCSIKTQMLQDKYDETMRELTKAQTDASNSAQSQYLLSVMGKWVANPAAA